MPEAMIPSIYRLKLYTLLRIAAAKSCNPVAYSKIHTSACQKKRARNVLQVARGKAGVNTSLK